MADTDSPTTHAGIQVIVVTPETTALETRASFVALPLFDGQIGIAPGHSPMIGRLGFGEMRIKTGDDYRNDPESDRYYVDGGFVQVVDNVVTVLTNRSVPVGELDSEAAKEQLEAARARSAAGDEAIAIRARLVDQARAQIRAAR